MIKVIHYLMKQKLLVNLVVVMICILGLFSLTNLNREAIPEVNFDMVSVTTVYPGGSPDETEQLISIPIEKKLREVDGIDKLRSYNVENVSVVVIYIDDKVPSVKKVVDDIKDKIDLIDNLPSKAERPIVEEITTDKSNVIDIAIYGERKNFPYRKLRNFSDQMEDFIYDIDGVAEVEMFGFEDREYLVEVDPGALTKYRIGMNSVINTLKNRNLDFPGGALRIGKKEFVLRTKGQFKDANQIRNTVIMANDIGFVTRIRDVAKVTDTYEEADVYHRFDGKKAVVLRVWKKRSADEIRLVNKLRDEIGKYKIKGYEDVRVSIFNDLSKYTRHRIASVLDNGITGFILLALILFLMLGPRMSSMVTFSIPLSFMVAFIAMKNTGITFNIISMFGLIMVIGMIVDFSIVVSENSHRYLETGMIKRAAIEKGVAEVFWPVTVTLVCISTAFAPLLLLSGIMGKFIRGIPIALITCLVASWFIAMFVLPTFLDTFSSDETAGKKRGKISGLWKGLIKKIFAFLPFKKNTEKTDLKEEDDNFEAGAFGKVQKGYKAFLDICVSHRYITLAVLFTLLTATLLLMPRVGFEFMPAGGEEGIKIKVKLPQSTNLKANLSEMRKIEKILLSLPENEFESLHSYVGEESSSALDPRPGKGTHKTTFRLHLSKEVERTRDAHEINDWIREKVSSAQKKGLISKNMDVKFEVDANGPPVGKPINVEIRGKDFKVLEKISNEYIAYLKTIDGVRDISLDLEEGKLEYRYSVNEVMAAQTGVSVADIGMALNASFEGAIATTVNEEEEEIDVRVRFPELARKRMNSLNEVMIANRNGGLIPLSRVTRVEKKPGYTQINRLNYKRLVQVQAEVDLKKITSIEANKMLMKKFRDIEKKYPGYMIAYGGEQEETNESMGEMGNLFLFALLVIYIVLAVYMGSLILPLVVMIAIPFALIGVILALYSHSQPLSFMGTLGFFSLAGVIVSNTLVLVEFINNLRNDGLSLKDALLEGGVIRLRPVILTTGTTVLGLIPSIYGLSLMGGGDKDHFVAPLALTFGYGLIFATFITLVLVPCFYHIAEDGKRFTARFLEKFGIKMNTEIYRPKVKPAVE